MPIYSLTAERLEKLKEAITRKKGEHDDLAKLSEKDLWCRDLDGFMEVWDEQMRIDAEIQTNIRRMGRRASKKIGAGRGRKPKDEDEYEPEKKSKAKGKAAAVKVETKSSQRFAEMFSAKPKPKKEPEVKPKEEDDFSDNDFAALSRSKPAAKEKPKAKPAPPASASLSASEEPEPEPSRIKRAVVSKAKSYFAVDSSDEGDDDDKMLEDVGDLVKGIGKESADTPGRLSLYAMSRPESSHGLSKAKSKSRVLDEDSVDDTNYEMLAKPSPHKPAKADDIDSFLSDDDEPSPAPVAKSKPAPKSKSSSTEPPGLLVAKKARGRPTGVKSKAKDDAPAKKAAGSLKQTTLSPAAKAYAAKKAVKKSALGDDSDEEMEEPSSPPPRAAARSRPGRAAAARRPIVIEEDSSMQVDEDDDEESDDPFNMDDDDD